MHINLKITPDIHPSLRSDSLAWSQLLPILMVNFHGMCCLTISYCNCYANDQISWQDSTNKPGNRLVTASCLTCLLKVFECDMVDREEADGGIVFGTHVGDGGPVWDRQLGHAGTKKLHKLPSYARLTKVLRWRTH